LSVVWRPARATAWPSPTWATSTPGAMAVIPPAR